MQIISQLLRSLERPVLLPAAEVPALADCQEIFDAGWEGAGAYLIDPTGARNEANAAEVWCEDGDTFILRRGQFNNAQQVPTMEEA